MFTITVFEASPYTVSTTSASSDENGKLSVRCGPCWRNSSWNGIRNLRFGQTLSVEGNPAFFGSRGVSFVLSTPAQLQSRQ